MTPGEIYDDTRERLRALVRDLDDAALDSRVPACPKWTVRQVVAHLAGAALDIATGNMAGAPGDEWTGKHVSDRAGRAIGDVLDEWAEWAPGVAKLVDDNPGMSAAVLDVLTHEQDVRAALNLPGARDTEGFAWGVQQAAAAIGAMLRRANAPSLRIESGDDEWLLGNGDGNGTSDGEPAASVTVDRFELFRAVFGRRSEAQVRSWSWDGDPAPYLDHLSVFGLRADDLGE